MATRDPRTGRFVKSGNRGMFTATPANVARWANVHRIAVQEADNAARHEAHVAAVTVRVSARERRTTVRSRGLRGPLTRAEVARQAARSFGC